jgi:hypothetical protein
VRATIEAILYGVGARMGDTGCGTPVAMSRLPSTQFQHSERFSEIRQFRTNCYASRQIRRLRLPPNRIPSSQLLLNEASLDKIARGRLTDAHKDAHKVARIKRRLDFRGATGHF